MIARFEKIGIAAGKPFNADKLDPEIRRAIEEGMKAGNDKIIEKTLNIGKKK
jgi:hypothetical protein